jgi:hypothetical protein
MKPKFLILLPFFTLLLSCKTDESGLSRREKIILNRCLENIHENAQSFRDSTYIVNPYFSPFEFNNFINKNYDFRKSNSEKNEVLEIIGLNNEEFQSLQKNINEKFLNKSFSDLKEMSTARKSRRIITFSGISENLVFLELITYLDEIDLDKLGNDSIVIDKKRVKGIISLAIVLGKESINQVIIGDGVVFER